MKNLSSANTGIKDWYVSSFEILENNLDGIRETPLHGIRKDAISKFSKLDFPTQKNEAWKYTSVKPILQNNYKLSHEASAIPDDLLKGFMFEGMTEYLLVFANGYFVKELSHINAGHPDLIVGSLGKAFTEYPEIVVRHLAKYARYEDEVFSALNTAFAKDGAFIFVPDNVILEHPIHLLNISDAGETSFHSHPRNLVIVGKQSEVQIVESYHHLSEINYFNNSVTEIFVDEDAKVRHIKIQDESEKSYHISTRQIAQERNSSYTSVNIDLGGAIVRNNLNVLLNDENCETHLNGFCMGHGKQHIDNSTLMDHAKPHCNSNELYKSILDEKAKGVFNGKVWVRQVAQKTNAFQSNKTLLLTDEASMNSKPQLEIFADDVKCSHGATIGQLDEEALFYLRSRGISEAKANSMLRFAFAADVLDTIQIQSVRRKLNKMISKKFKTKAKA
jgi:Fe-S cluster assembly protein SufD